jgi:hypothetical protein
LEEKKMGYLHCCGKLHRTKTFKLVPQSQFVVCELDYLKHCPACGHLVVQLTRIDTTDAISTIRKINDKALKFFDKLKSKILYEKKFINYKYLGKFYLNYNEFGVKKRCYANLSSLKMGLTENKC